MAEISAIRPAPSPNLRTPAYRFGEFTLDAANRLLSRNGTPIPLPARAFDCLLFLVQHAGKLVSKNELLDEVWANAFVEESNLTVAISTLRRALDEDPHERKYIQTISGRGYRFIANVEIIDEPLAAEPIPTPEPAPIPEALPTAPQRSRGAILWYLVISLIFTCLLAAWIVHHFRTTAFRIHSVAILPMTGKSVDDYILLGMTDTLIGSIGNTVAVRPMSSVFKYTTGHVDPSVVGREQGADAIVLSALTQDATNTQITLSLFRTSDDRRVWSQTYTDRTQNMPRLQQTLDQALNTEIAKFVDGGVKNVAATAPKTPVDNAAYQLYLRGRYFWNRRTEDGLHHSIDCFRQSIAIDPNYAPAYAGLADSYALLASFSVESGKAANPDARAAALSAIQLDPTLAEPHASLGMIYFFTDWNGPAAETEFERAIALNPNYATAHHWYALDLAAMGRFSEARYEIHRAQLLDPLSLIIGTNVGWIEYLNHSYDAAINEYRKVLELDPSFVRARTRLGIAEIRKGDFNAAVTDLEAAQKLSDDPYIGGLLGEALALSGKTAAAEHMLADLQARAKSKYVPPFSLALVYIGLRQNPAALAALEQSIDDRSTSMVYAKIDPSLDDLRNDPRFQKMISGMRF